MGQQIDLYLEDSATTDSVAQAKATKLVVWIVMIFLSLYPIWFVIGSEKAKKYNFPSKFIILFITVLLLTVQSIIQSQFPV